MSKLYDVEVKEIYRCITSVEADSEEAAISSVKALYEAGVLELDSEDISATEYSIVKGGVCCE